MFCETFVSSMCYIITVIYEIIEDLKQAVTYFPDYSQPFEIYTDACDYGIGSVLMQKDKVVGIFSTKFTDQQINYTIVEKELLAIIYGLENFRKIIYGAEITIYTDNRNLSWLNKNYSNKQRLHRWKKILEEYNINIKHIEGKNNGAADYLSRIGAIKMNEKIINQFPIVTKNDQENDKT